MAEIRHCVGIAARIDNVYEALTTTRGVASWWWEDARGDARATGRLECYFGDRPMVVMQIDEEQPNERVRWRCVQGPEEWVKTTVAFDVRRSSEETAVTLTHAGWREPTDFMGQSSTKWALYLVGLKRVLEGGIATPFPHCPPISNLG